MCGRYQFSLEESMDLRQIVEEIQRKYGAGSVRTGEIFPTNAVPVLLAEGAALAPELLGWGFPNFRNKGVVINARAETAEEKRMFRSSLLNRRCVIPSSGFFEWDKDKHKRLFRLPGEDAVYMAGFYSRFQDEGRVVILTTEANSSVAEFHHRMPVVLRKAELEPWVMELGPAMELLRRVPPMLENQVAG